VICSLAVLLSDSESVVLYRYLFGIIKSSVQFKKKEEERVED
jgi:hypothetical protein